MTTHNSLEAARASLAALQQAENDRQQAERNRLQVVQDAQAEVARLERQRAQEQAAAAAQEATAAAMRAEVVALDLQQALDNLLGAVIGLDQYTGQLELLRERNQNGAAEAAQLATAQMPPFPGIGQTTTYGDVPAGWDPWEYRRAVEQWRRDQRQAITAATQPIPPALPVEVVVKRWISAAKSEWEAQQRARLGALITGVLWDIKPGSYDETNDPARRHNILQRL